MKSSLIKDQVFFMGITCRKTGTENVKFAAVYIVTSLCIHNWLGKGHGSYMT